MLIMLKKFIIVVFLVKIVLFTLKIIYIMNAYSIELFSKDNLLKTLKACLQYYWINSSRLFDWSEWKHIQKNMLVLHLGINQNRGELTLDILERLVKYFCRDFPFLYAILSVCTYPDTGSLYVKVVIRVRINFD